MVIALFLDMFGLKYDGLFHIIIVWRILYMFELIGICIEKN